MGRDIYSVFSARWRQETGSSDELACKKEFHYFLNFYSKGGTVEQWFSIKED